MNAVPNGVSPSVGQKAAASTDGVVKVERFGPLVGFRGDRPPAPSWFHNALSIAPETSFEEVDGVLVEVLAWGRRGAPGLLFLHGMTANAWWWSFIAPFFAREYRCVAFSWSGMGRSGRRENYSVSGFARELASVSRASGVFESEAAPIVVAHSFGGVPLADHINATPDFGGAILVDRSVFARESPRPGPPVRQYKGATYDSGREALARFRLLPADECPNDFIVDHVARSALTKMTDSGGETRFGWDVDPSLRVKLGPFQFPYFDGRTPLGFVWGERSSLVSAAAIEVIRALHPTAPHIMVPDAGHHVMLDQPLALITALRTLLATGWSESANSVNLIQGELGSDRR